jgi:hypothetical protein
MRCKPSMEVSQDVVLCDASVQYMFCDAKDFATLIIDFTLSATPLGGSHLSAWWRLDGKVAGGLSLRSPALRWRHWLEPDFASVDCPAPLDPSRQLHL